MNLQLQIVSICRALPTPDDPVAGSFVFNRLSAMAQQARVHIVQPVPHFPLVRAMPAWARATHHVHGRLRIEHAPMFYLPGVLKRLDGYWLERSLRPVVGRLVRRPGLAVIDAHFGYPDGVGCVGISQRLRAPLFVTLRGLEADIIRQPALRGQMLDALHRASGCITVSHSLRRLIVDHGVASEKIAVIPNAVDRQIFRPGDRAAARAALGVRAGDPLIVSVANLLAVKRHDILLRALSQLRARRPNVRLAVIGGTAHEPGTPAALQMLSRTLGLGPAVDFLGRLPADQVVQWLRAADVFALASDREGCCNAVLEALATGTPVVATDAGDNAQYIESGTNGFVTPVGQVEALSAGLDRALSTEGWDADSISNALHASVGDWADVACKVLQFFRSRLSAVGAPAPASDIGVAAT